MSRRWTAPPDWVLTISNDVLCRPHERRRQGGVQRARGIEVDDQTCLAEIFQRNPGRILPAHDSRGEMRGVTAAVAVVAGNDDHSAADGLRFLKGEHRNVRAPRGFADAA